MIAPFQIIAPKITRPIPSGLCLRNKHTLSQRAKHINAVKFEFASIYQARCRWLDPALQLFNYFQAPCPVLDGEGTSTGWIPRRIAITFTGKAAIRRSIKNCDWLPARSMDVYRVQTVPVDGSIT